VIVRLWIIDAKTKRDVAEELGARGRDSVGRKVITDGEDPLVGADDEVRSFERRSVKPSIGVGDKLGDLFHGATFLIATTEGDGHAGGRATARRVEHLRHTRGWVRKAASVIHNGGAGEAGQLGSLVERARYSRGM
jgi:hypothetical protein